MSIIKFIHINTMFNVKSNVRSNVWENVGNNVRNNKVASKQLEAAYKLMELL